MNAEAPLSCTENQQTAERPKQPTKPGALRGQVWLTIQTSQAQQLIHGRDATPDKPPIIGLVGFADRLRLIWQAARGDDPYADWWLIQVNEAIAALATALAQQQSDLLQQLEQMTALAVSVAASQRPCRIPLRFANPYAYRAAQLLGEFDKLVCTAATARHVGLLDGAAFRTVQQTGAHQLRALFVLPHRYRFLKIDRASVRAQTGRSHEARQRMGELPEDILRGARLPPLAPRREKSPAPVADAVSQSVETPLVSPLNLPDENNHDRQ